MWAATWNSVVAMQFHLLCSPVLWAILVPAVCAQGRNFGSLERGRWEGALSVECICGSLSAEKNWVSHGIPIKNFLFEGGCCLAPCKSAAMLQVKQDVTVNMYAHVFVCVCKRCWQKIGLYCHSSEQALSRYVTCRALCACKCRLLDLHQRRHLALLTMLLTARWHSWLLTHMSLCVSRILC